MSFLVPALLAGLLAAAIPVIVHLVQRDRARKVAFPSLMFLRRIPNQSVRRRAIRDWPLLILRVAAIALIALAFARPLLSGGMAAGSAAGGRDLVILLDRSASMGYGDHWTRARDEARRAIDALGPADRATLILFDTEVEIGVRSSGDRALLLAAVDRAQPGPRATAFGPALRAAGGLLDASPLAERRIVLISDFQQGAWDRASDIRLPPGVVLSPRPLDADAASNVSTAGLLFERQPAPGGERITATARLVNRSASAVPDRDVVLEVDGHRIDAKRASLAAGSAGTVTFAPFVVGGQPARVTVRAAPDALPADDVFHAVVRAGGHVPALILESAGAAPETSLYLEQALRVAAAPGFEIATVRDDRAFVAGLSRARLIVINNTRAPSGAAARALEARVRDGAGVLVVLGERSAWPDGAPDLLPGTLGGTVDRSGTRGGTLGFVDHGHPVFEVFAAPRSGDLTAPRVFRYRELRDAPVVLARFDDGGVAVAERRVGRGAVLAWTSTLDGYWNDLAIKPVFVPLVHQAATHLARYVGARPWYTVGDVIDEARPAGGAAEPRGPGFHEIVPADPGSGQPAVVAVNLSPAESDLTRFEPADLVAATAASDRTAPGRAAGVALTPEESERRQSLWWYILAAGLVLLAFEPVAAGRFRSGR